MAPHLRARLGIGWVAQEREIFPSLSVEENLTVAARPGTLDARERLSTAAAFAGTAKQHGQSAFGRRAADAGDRARADDQSGAAAARRTAGRSGADHCRGTDRSDFTDDRRRQHGDRARGATRGDRAVAHRERGGDRTRRDRASRSFRGHAQGCRRARSVYRFENRGPDQRRAARIRKTAERHATQHQPDSYDPRRQPSATGGHSNNRCCTR